MGESVITKFRGQIDLLALGSREFAAETRGFVVVQLDELSLQINNESLPRMENS